MNPASVIKSIHVCIGNNPVSQPVAIDKGSILANFSSTSSTGEEAFNLSGDFLKPGPYFIGIVGPRDAAFTLSVSIGCTSP